MVIRCAVSASLWISMAAVAASTAWLTCISCDCQLDQSAVCKTHHMKDVQPCIQYGVKICCSTMEVR